jgi:hypothetical protein
MVGKAVLKAEKDKIPQDQFDDELAVLGLKRKYTKWELSFLAMKEQCGKAV